MTTPKKAILLSLCISIVLLSVKFLAYFITSSNAILTDAVESIANVAAGSFAFYSVYLSKQPKDENHPYGHGKVEFFSVFVEGSLICISGILIILKSGHDLIFPIKLTNLFDGAVIIGITGMVNAAVGFYLINIARNTQSLTLEAEGKHLLTDMMSSLALALGIIIIQLTGLLWLDSVISIGLGIYIFYSGYKLTRRSVGGLMDERNTDLLKNIISILQQNRSDSWIDMHNLRAQQYGADWHIDCHLTLPYYFSLSEVHEQISDIDKLINRSVNYNTEFFIHADPCLPNCCHYCRMKNCQARLQPYTIDIEWIFDNVTKNQKHFV